MKTYKYTQTPQQYANSWVFFFFTIGVFALGAWLTWKPTWYYVSESCIWGGLNMLWLMVKWLRETRVSSDAGEVKHDDAE